MSFRIVIDGRHFRDFGIGTYIRNLVQGLGRIDAANRYIVVCLESDQREFSGLPANFQTIPYRHTDTEKMDHIAFPAFLRQFAADLYHIPLNRVPWWMVRPYVVTIHDMSRQLFGSGLRNHLSLYRARRSLMRAARVIAVSSATRRAAETLLGIPPGHIRRIYNAPDPRLMEEKMPADARAAGPGAWEHERRRILERYQVNYRYLLYTGNIRPQKNIPKLIEAFAVLRGEMASHPEYGDLRLIIIGDEINQFPDVRLAAQKTRLGSAVRFLGHVPFDTLRAFYESAELFVFPSLHEGFGLPPLEAMSCGTPVVTSNVSSLPEVVGEAAMLVNPENVFEIERGMREVLLDRDLRRELIERGYQQAGKFSWDRTAAQVLETYLEAVRESS
ncbi:MAG: glycosyltransferase family 4 protein [Acidimicrobiia bacterium]|nr:glycosyltransferase family 4 protein [Acidimicrobiia bacterium]